MIFLEWIESNGFRILDSLISWFGFFAAVYVISENTKARKVDTLLALTEAHRELWKLLFERPHLWRVLDEDANVSKTPVTQEEGLFSLFVILHVRSSYKAREAGSEFGDDNFDADVRQLFSSPVISEVWKQAHVFQDKNFVDRIETILSDAASQRNRSNT